MAQGFRLNGMVATAQGPVRLYGRAGKRRQDVTGQMWLQQQGVAEFFTGAATGYSQVGDTFSAVFEGVYGTDGLHGEPALLSVVVTDDPDTATFTLLVANQVVLAETEPLALIGGYVTPV